jgi:hypothetical protein
MAHYAFLDENNVVTEVITGVDETDLSQNWEEFYGAIKNQVCKRTSYNGNYRKNYAGIGYTFREDLNEPDGAFVPPQPFASWKLSNITCNWKPPVPRPDDGLLYDWNEKKLKWDLVPAK